MAFLLLAGTAKATDFSDCLDITTPGRYDLTASFTASRSDCIVIRASDVEVYFHLHNITAGTLLRTGVLIQAPSSTHISNISIIGVGGIIGFSENAGVYVDHADNVTISSLMLYDNQYGIVLVDSLYARVYSNWMVGNSFSVKVQGRYPYGGYGIDIWNNYMNGNVKDLDFATGCFEHGWVRGNVMGDFSINSTCCLTTYITVFPFINIPTTTCLAPCWGGFFSGADTNLDCYNCNYNDFVGNMFSASHTDAAVRGSQYNRFIRNTFFKWPGQTQNGLFLYATANNNWGCGLSGQVYDSGINNTFIADCPASLYSGQTVGQCVPEWVCISNTELAYKMLDCSYYNVTITCGAGEICQNDACVSVTATTVGVYANYTAPSEQMCNVTEMYATGSAWAIPFCTPLFWAILIMFVVAGIISYAVAKTGAGGNTGAVVFVSVCLMFTIFYTMYGIFPTWIAALFGLAEALILAYLLSGIFGGK
jgi:parallel beta-helix repeat protein